MTMSHLKIDSQNQDQYYNFDTYEDYLDSFITSHDLQYLHKSTARKVIELSNKIPEILDRESFYRYKESIKNYLDQRLKPLTLDSSSLNPAESLARELCNRENANRRQLISTIIFIHLITEATDTSAYIDYADRLKKESWRKFFMEKKLLIPRKSDLSYYNWKSGYNCMNETSNYVPIIDSDQGILFKNLHDDTSICIDPKRYPGVDTNRVTIKSDKYTHIIIYDHKLPDKKS